MFKYLYLHLWIMGLSVLIMGLMDEKVKAMPLQLPVSLPQQTDITSTLMITNTTSINKSITPTIAILPTPLQQSKRALYVDQLYQTMFVYENGQIIRSIPVSTGLPTRTTLTKSWLGTVGVDKGAGRVYYGYTVDYKWQLYKDLYGNILIHSVPYTTSNQSRYYDQPEALGVRPTSHGCIRVGETDAAWLKGWNPTGAAIYISPSPLPLITTTIKLVTPTLTITESPPILTETMQPSTELPLYNSVVLTEHLRYQLAQPSP